MNRLSYYISSSIESFLEQRAEKFFKKLQANGSKHKESSGEIISHHAVVIELRKLLRKTKLHGITIVLEMGFKTSRTRADIVLLGEGQDGKKNIIIIEAKSFDNTISVPDSPSARESFLIHTDTYGDIEHPSAKAKKYRDQLLKTLPELSKQNYHITAIGWAPNYKRKPRRDPLHHPAYDAVNKDYYTFDHDTTEHLVCMLCDKLARGHGYEIWHDILAMAKTDANRTTDPPGI